MTLDEYRAEIRLLEQNIEKIIDTFEKTHQAEVYIVKIASRYPKGQPPTPMIMVGTKKS